MNPEMSDTSSPSKAAAFGAGCLWLVATYAGLAVVTYRLTAPVTATPSRIAFTLMSALFLTLGLSSFWSLARGAGRAEQSLAELVRRARMGELPQDGKPVVADGFVRALSSALTAPLSGVACAAYWYRMYYVSRNSRGNPSQVPVYWGYACRPFAIDSPVARLRVLAVPQMLHAPEPRQGPDVIERARRWVEATRFEPVEAHVLATLDATFALARDIFSDEDGEARRDWKREGDERDPETLRLEETLLPVGAAASAHGVWSAERGAIVSEGSALGTAVSVVLGRAEELQGAPGAGHSFGKYLVTATLFTALGAGLVWFARIFPTLL
jgi:hypothetical protein